MKAKFVSCAMALLAFGAIAPSPAEAAGPLDGIYRLGNTSTYWSVHQNGNGVIVASFATIPSTGVEYRFIDGQTFVPNRADVWDLLSGSLSAGRVLMTGQVFNGACTASLEAFFSPNSIFVNVLGFNAVPGGASQTVNCPSIYNALRNAGGTLYDLTRVY